MTRYLIGIDNGSQSSKVTVFDERGRVVSSGRCPLRPTESPRPGSVEHPGDDLWDSIGEATREALAGINGDIADVVAVGLCTIRFCRALLREDGSLAGPLLSWMDDRVSRPYEHVDDEVAWVTTSSGYITYRLTGLFRDTAANYQGQWPIDTDTWRWPDPDDPRFAAFGVRPDQLFTLVNPGEILGRVTAAASRHTGLPEGLPVVATSNDKAVEALGCGLASADTLVLSLGTYVASMTTGARNVHGASSSWTNFSSVPSRYLYEGHGIRRGMWTVSWFRDLLGPEAADAAAERGLTLEQALGSEAEEVPRGSDGLLTVLDWLAPTEAPFRRGSILGFDARHGRAHVYRSILEAIAMTTSRRSRDLAAELDSRFTRVLVTGGGTNSDLLMQLVADTHGVPAVRMEVGDAAGLGAAICAAVGLGVHPWFDEAQAAMVRERDVFVPDPAGHAFYARLSAIHGDVTRHTDAVYRRLAELTG